MMLPLAGMTVVSLEQAVAAPLASRHLADWGARVIKIERPGAGDFARHYDDKAKGLSSHFVWTNRNKESLTLDLKQEDGRQILERLLAGADVFLHNLAPGAVDRLGFPAERLRANYPQLIICAISGFGGSGPYRDKRAYDLLIQAEAGLLSVTGTAERPAKAGISVADIAAGMYAYSGILMALLRRQQRGEGCVLEVSMLEALAEWMGFPAYYSLGGEPPGRNGASHATIVPYGPFATGDGRVIMLGVQNEREWGRFCARVLQRPWLAEDERFAGNGQRVANQAALQAEIEAVFGQLPAAEIVARLDAAQIANAEMRTVPDFLAHPQLAARGRWRTIGSSAGELPALLPPVTMSGMEPVLAPVPAVGEHSQAILGELGYEAADIERLRETQVI